MACSGFYQPSAFTVSPTSRSWLLQPWVCLWLVLLLSLSQIACSKRSLVQLSNCSATVIPVISLMSHTDTYEVTAITLRGTCDYE
jgi:hypothetical protein